MEHAFGQLQFNMQFLATLGACLTCVVWRHLMEVFTIAFCCPVTPIKEHAPRRIGNRLRKMPILYHVAGFEFLSNNGIKTFREW